MDRNKVDTTTGTGVDQALKEVLVAQVPMGTCMVEVQILQMEVLRVRLPLQDRESPESKLNQLSTELVTELMVMPL